MLYTQLITQQITAVNTPVDFSQDIDQRFKYLVGVNAMLYQNGQLNFVLASDLPDGLSVDGMELFAAGYYIRNLVSGITVPPNERFKKVFRELKVGATQSKLKAKIQCKDATMTAFFLTLELILSNCRPPWADNEYALFCCEGPRAQ